MEKHIYLEEGNQNYVVDTLKVTRYLAAQNCSLKFGMCDDEITATVISEGGVEIITASAPWNLGTVLYHHLAQHFSL